jgi:hypothetical protein
MDKFRKIVVAGLARNVAKEIVRSYETLSNAFSMFDDVTWLIIESDSSDGTIEELNKLKNKYNNISYYSLGNLEAVMKSRTERIAYCRNVYLEKIFNMTEYADCDYVAIADLDSVNHEITYNGVLSCWEHQEWDVCTANQDGPYYDLWALNCDGWNTGDCWEQFNFLKKYINDDWALAVSVVGKMIKIDKNSEFISVNSAFGGLAIYRKSILIGGGYIGISVNGAAVCEHISLHKTIKEKDGRIYINPKMINSGPNEHTRNHLKFLNQIKR